MKHNPLATANAAGVTTAIVFVVCRLLVGLLPELTLNIAKAWFHSFNIATGDSWNLSLEAFILGIITATITAWLIGYLFAVIYNAFNKK